MGNGGKLLLGLLGLALALLLVIFLAAWFDPAAVAARELNQPWQVWAGRIVWAGLAAGLAAALVGAGLWALGRGLGQIVQAFTVGPQHGLYPLLLFLGKHITQPANEPKAQIVAALAWNLDRLNQGSVKAALAPRPGDELLPEPPPAPQLPGRVLIYNAPATDQLALPVGVAADGPVALPLRDFGSGLVGGLQGMGKSEAVASMIAGLLQQDASGRVLKLAVADLKGGVDFGRIPDDLPALAWPVAKDEATGLALMRNVWAEVQRRQTLLDGAGCNRIEVYNQRPGVTPEPYLLAFVDEIMMLSMAAGERGLSREDRAQSAEFNALATRVVSVGRALGVALIAATQRPSSEVIPTKLRDLCGMRLAFRCATDDASRAILGVGGAELLPREPGRALLVYADAQPREVRTYLADLENRRFDRFMAGLRTGRTPGPVSSAVIEAQPVAERDGVHTYAASAALPAAPAPDMRYPDDPKAVTDFDAAQRAGIARLYWQLGSLSAVEWYIWQQKGGAKFYLVREIVNEELRRRGA